MKRAAIGVAAACLASTVAACGAGPPADGPSDPVGEPVPSEARAARGVRALDGDSVVLDIDGEEVEARLIGLNAPERDECWGDEARSALAAFVDDRPLSVTTDVEERDQFGRLLVYLWAEDGTFVNGDLAERGQALAASFPPNTSRQDAIDEAETRAVAAGAGLWSGCASSASDTIALADVAPNPPGPDEEALLDEWVAFTNTGTAPLDVGGWVLRDASTANRYTFPAGTTVAPGATVRIRTGCGADSPTDLHWCAEGPVWNNGGDEILLLDAAGDTVLATSYDR